MLDEDFYISAIDFWTKEYLEIKKNKLFTPKIYNMTSKNAKDYLLNAFIAEKGLNEVADMTENWKEFFSTKKELQRFKASLTNIKALTEVSPLMAELDRSL